MTTHQVISALLIEDNDGDVLLIEKMLQKTAPGMIKLMRVDCLKKAIEALKQDHFDVLLLDLGLPDSIPDTTLSTILPQSTDIPILVLTGLGEGASAISEIQAGTQDYLIKGKFDGKLLYRFICNSVERYQLLKARELAKIQKQQNSEIHSLDRLTSEKSLSVTASSLNINPIKKQNLALFNRLVISYREILEKQVENSIYKEKKQIPSAPTDFADELGSLRANPRDVIDIHKAALLLESDNQTEQKMAAYLAEGRVLLLELMGHLLNYYLKHQTSPISTQILDETKSQEKSDVEA